MTTTKTSKEIAARAAAAIAADKNEIQRLSLLKRGEGKEWVQFVPTLWGKWRKEGIDTPSQGGLDTGWTPSLEIARFLMLSTPWGWCRFRDFVAECCQFGLRPNWEYRGYSVYALSISHPKWGWDREGRLAMATAIAEEGNYPFINDIRFVGKLSPEEITRRARAWAETVA